MQKKGSLDQDGVVFSTDPDFKPRGGQQPEQGTLIPKEQKLLIRMDTKQRGGKVVTLVEGFIGMEADLEKLGKELKTACGAGGSVKEGVVLIQGDQKEKVRQWLEKNGYSTK
jgi:translation initiation factor 1